MVLKVTINTSERNQLLLFHAALSEPDRTKRIHLIDVIKHYIVAQDLHEVINLHSPAWFRDPRQADFTEWIMQTCADRDEALIEFGELAHRHDAKHNTKLQIAEHIGSLVLKSILEEEFRGLHSNRGILEQVSHEAKQQKLFGAKDLATLGTIWKAYRGVVHLGLALDLCDAIENRKMNPLQVAEEYRKRLSESCPRGTKTPYIDEAEQISFIDKSNAWGPRLVIRGLQNNVD